MRYETIDANNNTGKKSSDLVLQFLNQADYDSGAYVHFESFLKSQGQLDMADQVYAKSIQRQKRSFPSRIWNGFLEFFTFHGRKPYRALLVALVFFFVGLLVYWKEEKMELVDQAKRCHYNPFWYSLGVFVPFVKLQVAELWRPCQNRRFARHIVYILQISGWLLLTIGVYFALASMIKQ